MHEDVILCDNDDQTHKLTYENIADVGLLTPDDASTSRGVIKDINGQNPF